MAFTDSEARNERLKQMSDDIQALLEARDLLFKVWLEMGSYGEGKIPDQLRWKVNDYFNFDDSE